VLALDLADGTRTRLPVDSFLAYPYEWLDDDTVAVLSLARAARPTGC
jgi:hypothetical protein